MGKKKKWVETHRSAIEQLSEEVGKNAYRTFLIEELPVGVINNSGQAAKVSSVMVMTSGSADESRDWMVVVPLRVDTSASLGAASPQRFVHDKDPMTFYLSSQGVPGVSGSISFHTKYPGRTEDAPVLQAPRTVQEAVADIRDRYTAASGSFSDADASLQNALQYGVSLFRAMEAELDTPGIPPFDEDE